MRKLAAGLFALALALTGVACGDDGGGGGDSKAIDALALAADKATDAGTAHMVMTMEMNVSGQQVSIEGEGDMSFADEIGEMTMTMSAPGIEGGQSIEMILDGTYVYMKMPAQLGGTGGWARMDLTKMPGGASNQFAQDPSQYLEFLRGASEDGVEEVGSEEIDGVETTHYKATLAYDKILDQAPDQEAAEEVRAQLESLGGDIDSIPAEVWIDEEGLPRRMKMDMSVDAQGQTAEILITMEFSDYGVEVDIQPPKDFEEIEAPTG